MQYVPILRFSTTEYQAQTVAALCAVMLVGGLLSLLYGYRSYKVVVVVGTALLGAYIGRFFLYPHLPEKYAMLAPLGLGLLGALVALPVQKVMVFLAGASVGFLSLGPVVAEMIWKAPEGPTPTQYLVAAVAAFLVMGVLALVLFKPVLIIATGMFGATLVLSGMVHMVEAFSETPSDLYQTYPQELAWTFVGIAVVGAVFQASTLRKAKQKT